MASHPERLQYIYFNTVLLLRAVARIGPYLSAYDYCALGTQEDDANTLGKISKVVSIASNVGMFDESAMFRGDDANVSYFMSGSRCVLNRFNRFLRRNSKIISAMSPVSWTV